MILAQQHALQLAYNGKSDEYCHPEELCIIFLLIKCTCFGIMVRFKSVLVDECQNVQCSTESRAIGTVNTTDKSFYDIRLRNSALAEILEQLPWITVRTDFYIYVCQARLVSQVNYTQE